MGVTRWAADQKGHVDITFAVRDGRDYLLGSEVSEHLRKLSLVEFSFYIGFPAQQIAERMTHMKHFIYEHVVNLTEMFVKHFFTMFV